jgi:hypothetical protein
MEKTLIIKIPNELWVDDFSENKTADFTYSGPDKVWFLIEKGSTKVTVSPVTFATEPQVNDNQIAVPVEIATATDVELAAAIILQPELTPHQYTHAKQTNYDGSIYYKISNPNLNDYYDVASSITGDLSLVLIEKHMPNPNLFPALQKKQLVEKYLADHDFDAEDRAKVEAYLATISDYVNKVKTAYTWKFITVPNDVPEIPPELMALFNTLPPPVAAPATIPA